MSKVNLAGINHNFPLDNYKLTKPRTDRLESVIDMISPSTKPVSIKRTNKIFTVYKTMAMNTVLSSHDSNVCRRDPKEQ